MASRGAFLRGQPSYLHYLLWHQLEENDLLLSAIARIDSSIAGPDSACGIPSVFGSNKKRKIDRKEMGVVAKSIAMLAQCNEMAVIIEANTSKWNTAINVYLQTKIERTKLHLQLCQPATIERKMPCLNCCWSK